MEGYIWPFIVPSRDFWPLSPLEILASLTPISPTFPSTSLVTICLYGWFTVTHLVIKCWDSSNLVLTHRDWFPYLHIVMHPFNISLCISLPWLWSLTSKPSRHIHFGITNWVCPEFIRWRRLKPRSTPVFILSECYLYSPSFTKVKKPGSQAGHKNLYTISITKSHLFYLNSLLLIP